MTVMLRCHFLTTKNCQNWILNEWFAWHVQKNRTSREFDFKCLCIILCVWIRFFDFVSNFRLCFENSFIEFSFVTWHFGQICNSNFNQSFIFFCSTGHTIESENQVHTCTYIIYLIVSENTQLQISTHHHSNRTEDRYWISNSNHRFQR